ncbi:hypothetical protein [Sphingomonas sp. SRS2]|uniref:hypothetical protein n=1 Tax=Sphingomonas sp. SRS2 TaxID=133190 RepID=UPI00061840A1|nr:hypothetical protein [Sphingomonas sp. SRS2]KKC27429.1 hypothetical protein WP12_03375 [Sphingomonas sp. SRS2]
MVSYFPDWATTVGKMLAVQDGRGHKHVMVMCDTCKEARDVDLAAIVETKGADFSLINRRARCRLTAGCKGWNRFRYQSGVMRPLWTDRQADGWIELEWQIRKRGFEARQRAAEVLRESRPPKPRR